MHFHLLGLAHLPTSKRYAACAFTQKNVKLAKMLISLGHEVYLYGCKSNEGPQPECTEFIETHTTADIANSFGSGDNRFEIGYDWQNNEFRHDFNTLPTLATLKFRHVCIDLINQWKRPDDFLLITQGYYHKPIGDAVGLKLTCEPGIGYRGSYCEYRAFESAYIQNFTYGSEHPRQSINGSYWDRVIPNYFDSEDLEFSVEKSEYYLYIGRMIQRKGVMTAIKTCNHIGAKLLIAGQGGRVLNNGCLQGQDFVAKPGTWEYIGYVDFEARKQLFSHAIATFVPTLYLEPFAGTHIESMLSGTPVITTNFGVFPETVIDGINGYRCNMLRDFVNAAKEVSKLHPNKIRQSAERFLCNDVKYQFQDWFIDLYMLYESCQDPSILAWHRL